MGQSNSQPTVHNETVHNKTKESRDSKKDEGAIIQTPGERRDYLENRGSNKPETRSLKDSLENGLPPEAPKASTPLQQKVLTSPTNGLSNGVPAEHFPTLRSINGVELDHYDFEGLSEDEIHTIEQIFASPEGAEAVELIEIVGRRRPMRGDRRPLREQQKDAVAKLDRFLDRLGSKGAQLFSRVYQKKTGQSALFILALRNDQDGRELLSKFPRTDQIRLVMDMRRAMDDSRVDPVVALNAVLSGATFDIDELRSLFKKIYGPSIGGYLLGRLRQAGIASEGLLAQTNLMRPDHREFFSGIPILKSEVEDAVVSDIVERLHAGVEQFINRGSPKDRQFEGFEIVKSQLEALTSLQKDRIYKAYEERFGISFGHDLAHRNDEFGRFLIANHIPHSEVIIAAMEIRHTLEVDMLEDPAAPLLELIRFTPRQHYTEVLNSYQKIYGTSAIEYLGQRAEYGGPQTPEKQQLVREINQAKADPKRSLGSVDNQVQFLTALEYRRMDSREREALKNGDELRLMAFAIDHALKSSKPLEYTFALCDSRDPRLNQALMDEYKALFGKEYGGAFEAQFKIEADKLTKRMAKQEELLRGHTNNAQATYQQSIQNLNEKSSLLYEWTVGWFVSQGDIYASSATMKADLKNMEVEGAEASRLIDELYGLRDDMSKAQAALAQWKSLDQAARSAVRSGNMNAADSNYQEASKQYQEALRVLSSREVVTFSDEYLKGCSEAQALAYKGVAQFDTWERRLKVTRTVCYSTAALASGNWWYLGGLATIAATTNAVEQGGHMAVNGKSLKDAAADGALDTLDNVKDITVARLATGLGKGLGALGRGGQVAGGAGTQVAPKLLSVQGAGILVRSGVVGSGVGVGMEGANQGYEEAKRNLGWGSAGPPLTWSDRLDRFRHAATTGFLGGSVGGGAAVMRGQGTTGMKVLAEVTEYGGGFSVGYFTSEGDIADKLMGGAQSVAASKIAHDVEVRRQRGGSGGSNGKIAAPEVGPDPTPGKAETGEGASAAPVIAAGATAVEGASNNPGQNPAPSGGASTVNGTGSGTGNSNISNTQSSSSAQPGQSGASNNTGSSSGSNNGSSGSSSAQTVKDASTQAGQSTTSVNTEGGAGHTNNGNGTPVDTSSAGKKSFYRYMSPDSFFNDLRRSFRLERASRGPSELPAHIANASELGLERHVERGQKLRTELTEAKTKLTEAVKTSRNVEVRERLAQNVKTAQRKLDAWQRRDCYLQAVRDYQSATDPHNKNIQDMAKRMARFEVEAGLRRPLQTLRGTPRYIADSFHLNAHRVRYGVSSWWTNWRTDIQARVNRSAVEIETRLKRDLKPSTPEHASQIENVSQGLAKLRHGHFWNLWKNRFQLFRDVRSVRLQANSMGVKVDVSISRACLAGVGRITSPVTKPIVRFAVTCRDSALKLFSKQFWRSVGERIGKTYTAAKEGLYDFGGKVKENAIAFYKKLPVTLQLAARTIAAPFQSAYRAAKLCVHITQQAYNLLYKKPMMFLVRLPEMLPVYLKNMKTNLASFMRLPLTEKINTLWKGAKTAWNGLGAAVKAAYWKGVHPIIEPFWKLVSPTLGPILQKTIAAGKWVLNAGITTLNYLVVKPIAFVIKLPWTIPALVRSAVSYLRNPMEIVRAIGKNVPIMAKAAWGWAKETGLTIGRFIKREAIAFYNFLPVEWQFLCRVAISPFQAGYQAIRLGLRVASHAINILYKKPMMFLVHLPENFAKYVANLKLHLGNFWRLPFSEKMSLMGHGIAQAARASKNAFLFVCKHGVYPVIEPFWKLVDKVVVPAWQTVWGSLKWAGRTTKSLYINLWLKPWHFVLDLPDTIRDFVRDTWNSSVFRLRMTGYSLSWAIDGIQRVYLARYMRPEMIWIFSGSRGPAAGSNESKKPGAPDPEDDSSVFPEHALGGDSEPSSLDADLDAIRSMGDEEFSRFFDEQFLDYRADDFGDSDDPPFRSGDSDDPPLGFGDPDDPPFGFDFGGDENWQPKNPPRGGGGGGLKTHARPSSSTRAVRGAQIHFGDEGGLQRVYEDSATGTAVMEAPEGFVDSMLVETKPVEHIRVEVEPEVEVRPVFDEPPVPPQEDIASLRLLSPEQLKNEADLTKIQIKKFKHQLETLRTGEVTPEWKNVRVRLEAAEARFDRILEVLYPPKTAPELQKRETVTAAEEVIPRTRVMEAEGAVKAPEQGIADTAVVKPVERLRVRPVERFPKTATPAEPQIEVSPQEHPIVPRPDVEIRPVEQVSERVVPREHTEFMPRVFPRHVSEPARPQLAKNPAQKQMLNEEVRAQFKTQAKPHMATARSTARRVAMADDFWPPGGSEPIRQKLTELTRQEYKSPSLVAAAEIERQSSKSSASKLMLDKVEFNGQEIKDQKHWRWKTLFS